MLRAIELSINSVKNNGGPFGCVIVKDNNRNNTINKMRMALDELVVEGIKTNKSLHQKILEDEGFRNIEYYIKYLEEKLI